MSDTVDIAWIRDRLVNSAGLSEARAGELIHQAMTDGKLKAVASHATRRPESSATRHTEEDFSEEDFTIPRDFWGSAQVNWHDRYPYFRFFHKKQVWLTSSLSVERATAVAFLRNHDPLSQPPPAVERLAAATKGSGGARAKVDWERCLIEAARWMYVEGVPPKQADLVRYIAEWLGGDAPGDTQLKAHLGPLYRAFEDADRQD